MSRLKPPRFVFFLGAVEEPCVLRISSICVTWCIQIWDSFICVTCSFILEAWLIRTWDLAHSYTRAVQIPKRALHIFKRALHILKRALHILKTSPHLEKSPTTSQKRPLQIIERALFILKRALYILVWALAHLYTRALRALLVDICR